MWAQKKDYCMSKELQVQKKKKRKLTTMSRSTENLLAPTWITDLQEFRLGLLLAKAKACLKMFLRIKYSEFFTYNRKYRYGDVKSDIEMPWYRTLSHICNTGQGWCSVQTMVEFAHIYGSLRQVTTNKISEMI